MISLRVTYQSSLCSLIVSTHSVHFVFLTAVSLIVFDGPHAPPLHRCRLHCVDLSLLPPRAVQRKMTNHFATVASSFLLVVSVLGSCAFPLSFHVFLALLTFLIPLVRLIPSLCRLDRDPSILFLASSITAFLFLTFHRRLGIWNIERLEASE